MTNNLQNNQNVSSFTTGLASNTAFGSESNSTSNVVTSDTVTTNTITTNSSTNNVVTGGTTVSGNTTTTTTIVRKETDPISYKSSFMINFRKNVVSSGHSMDFDEIDSHYSQNYKEIKEFFLYQPIGKYNMYDTVCSPTLSELESNFPDQVKSKLYVSAILDNKDKILQILNNKVNFETLYKSNYYNSKLEQTLYSLSDEMIYIAEYFDSEVIGRISTERSSAEQITKMQEFIRGILDENNEPRMRNIGQNTELKIKYIKLANFLLKFKEFGNTTLGYEGLSNSVKTHLSAILNLRNTLIVSLTEWIRFIIGDVYAYAHKIEGITVDQFFLDGLQIEYASQEEISRIKSYYEVLISQITERLTIEKTTEITKMKSYYEQLISERTTVIEKTVEKIVEVPVEKIVYVERNDVILKFL
jgi:hypothetical protein